MSKIEEAMKLIGPSCICEVNLGNVLLLTGALKEAIEQHEAFRQEVSDAVVRFNEFGFYINEDLERFIIAKPDPLMELVKDLYLSDEYADRIRAALAKRGLEIREKGE